MPFFKKVREAAAAFRSRAVKEVTKHLSTVMGFSRNFGGLHLVFHKMVIKMGMGGEQWASS